MPVLASPRELGLGPLSLGPDLPQPPGFPGQAVPRGGHSHGGGSSGTARTREHGSLVFSALVCVSLLRCGPSSQLFPRRPSGSRPMPPLRGREDRGACSAASPGAQCLRRSGRGSVQGRGLVSTSGAAGSPCPPPGSLATTGQRRLHLGFQLELTLGQGCRGLELGATCLGGLALIFSQGPAGSPPSQRRPRCSWWRWL